MVTSEKDAPAEMPGEAAVSLKWAVEETVQCFMMLTRDGRLVPGDGLSEDEATRGMFASLQQMFSGRLGELEARALAAEAALAAERERCADLADMAAEREDARAFENDDDLHVAECRGAERAAKAIAAAIRAGE